MIESMNDLRAKLHAKGLTPRELSRATGLTENYIHIVLSRKKIPKLATIALIISKSKRAFVLDDFVPSDPQRKGRRSDSAA